MNVIQRSLLSEGGLEKLMVQDGLTGLTSNPATFEQAIVGGTDHASTLQELAAEKGLKPQAVHQWLIIRG